MYQNVRVVEVILNSELEKIFPGPKFGINGIRKLIGHTNSILCPVLKPQGFSSDELAIDLEKSLFFGRNKALNNKCIVIYGKTKSQNVNVNWKLKKAS